MLIGQWMLYLILRHFLKKPHLFFEPFRLRLSLKFKKVLQIDNRTLNLFFQIKYRFDTDSGSVEKVEKNPAKKVINEKN